LFWPTDFRGEQNAIKAELTQARSRRELRSNTSVSGVCQADAGLCNQNLGAVSRQDLTNHVAGNIRQAEVATQMAVCQSLVGQAQQVQDGGM
jgi:hypothetical protein